MSNSTVLTKEYEILKISECPLSGELQVGNGNKRGRNQIGYVALLIVNAWI